MGFDATLPLIAGGLNGFLLVEGMEEAVKQDFLILLMTEPGERTMDPDFGVGLKKYLFQNLTRDVFGHIENRIKSQTLRYMSFLTIENISFASALDTPANSMLSDIEENKLSISITYSYGHGIVDEITVSP
tara:strand:- start:888 stop:1280 length:393 start_codon:yes stop_codon:yes gene_type:complete